MNFHASTVNLDPEPGTDPGWVFYSVTYASDGSQLTGPVITYNVVSEDFFVYTDDQSKAG